MAVRKKKLLLLGGIRYLLPVIEAAHSQGYYVITADYLPSNEAHKFSDEYININIIDKESVLKAAITHRIDGIMSFGVDPGVVTAAYIAEAMGLPNVGPYESVAILQHKDSFRSFLSGNGFNTPWSYSYSSVQEAWEDKSRFSYPLMVKPTDSAGSKGCSRVDNEESLIKAFQIAYQYSFCKRIIVEQYIEKKGFSSDSDCYSSNGKLSFVSFNSQWFDNEAANPHTPSGFSFPSSFSTSEKIFISSELQRLISLLQMKTSIYNVEARIGQDGRPYIMEVSPRGGGNRLCELLKYATGTDLISAIVKYSIEGTSPQINQIIPSNNWAEIILHSNKPGIFTGISIYEDTSFEIVEKDIWIKEGDTVNAFRGANDSIGTIMLRARNQDTLKSIMSSQKEWLNINVI